MTALFWSCIDHLSSLLFIPLALRWMWNEWTDWRERRSSAGAPDTAASNPVVRSPRTVVHQTDSAETVEIQSDYGNDKLIYEWPPGAPWPLLRPASRPNAAPTTPSTTPSPSAQKNDNDPS